MTTAIILAGGSGHRMNQEVPKQFICVRDKPLIIYTLEAFQRHSQIDQILCVCLEGWQGVLTAYAKQYGITKLKWVVSGGDTGQESIRNGVYHLKGICDEKDIVVVHDGIRPLVDEAVLSDVINKCRQYGNAVTSLPYNEQIFLKTDEYTTNRYIPRETLRRVSTPQAYLYGKILWAYQKAFRDGIGIYGSSYANTMMADLGETLYFAAGSDKNIKITTQDDLVLFEALLRQKSE